LLHKYLKNVDKVAMIENFLNLDNVKSKKKLTN